MYRFKFRDRAELENFMREELVSLTDTLEILGCSKQYLWDLVKKDRIVPAVFHNKYKLYWKEDILAFQKQREEKKNKTKKNII